MAEKNNRFSGMTRAELEKEARKQERREKRQAWLDGVKEKWHAWVEKIKEKWHAFLAKFKKEE